MTSQIFAPVYFSVRGGQPLPVGGGRPLHEEPPAVQPGPQRLPLLQGADDKLGQPYRHI